ncbi:hypothetical protein [Mesorhizobium kowhaii]|nr:hypothetical protein [Mesorhizobium kowhaii]
MAFKAGILFAAQLTGPQIGDVHLSSSVKASLSKHQKLSYFQYKFRG